MTTTVAPSRAHRISSQLKRNRGRSAILASLAFIFLSGLLTMDSGDWMVTVLRGLAGGATPATPPPPAEPLLSCWPNPFTCCRRGPASFAMRTALCPSPGGDRSLSPQTNPR